MAVTVCSGTQLATFKLPCWCWCCSSCKLALPLHLVAHAIIWMGLDLTWAVSTYTLQTDNWWWQYQQRVENCIGMPPRVDRHL